jgi:hypothetical protein
MLRRPKHSKIEVVAPKEEEEEVEDTTVHIGRVCLILHLCKYTHDFILSLLCKLLI